MRFFEKLLDATGKTMRLECLTSSYLVYCDENIIIWFSFAYIRRLADYACRVDFYI